MAKIKKAQNGVIAASTPIPSLRKGQLKRLGRLEAKNPDRATRVADRMIERDTRLQRGKSFVNSKLAAVPTKATPTAVPKSKTGGKVKSKKK